MASSQIDETLAFLDSKEGEWIFSTNQPGREMLSERRTQVLRMLRTGLFRSPSRQVEEALTLPANIKLRSQDVRKGTRAVLLSSFVLGNTPLGRARELREKLLKQDRDTLRRSFLATLPSIFDAHDAARSSWDPSHFTDPRMFPDRKSGAWPNAKFRFIVHCLPTDVERAAPILAAPGTTLRSWAAISTSVVDETNAVIYGRYGLILRVPAGNVMVSSSEDLNLLNHLGTDMTRNREAELKIDNLVERAALLSRHIVDLSAKHGRLKTPLECIRSNRNGRWIEIAIIGRHPSTGAGVEVAGLFYRVNPNGDYHRVRPNPKSPNQTPHPSPITPQIEQLMTVASRTFRLPILHIPDRTSA